MKGYFKEFLLFSPHFLLNFVCVKCFDSMIQEPALWGPVFTIHAISPVQKEGMLGRGRRYPRVVHYISKDTYLLK